MVVYLLVVHLFGPAIKLLTCSRACVWLDYAGLLALERAPITLVCLLVY